MVEKSIQTFDMSFIKKNTKYKSPKKSLVVNHSAHLLTEIKTPLATSRDIIDQIFAYVAADQLYKGGGVDSRDIVDQIFAYVALDSQNHLFPL